VLDAPVDAWRPLFEERGGAGCGLPRAKGSWVVPLNPTGPPGNPSAWPSAPQDGH
jgi:hypothetical protein